MAKWTKIEDIDVRHIWKCPECGKEVIIDPTWNYADDGAPICTGEKSCDGMEMEYVRTEILKGN